MNASDLQYEDISISRGNTSNNSKIKKVVSSRQSLKAKFDKEYKLNKRSSGECTARPNCTSWCDALSITVPNVNARQAWRTGTEKISQTFNNVRNTFGTLSQRIIKANKRRQPLINLDSPQTPVTPQTRSKALLGRTPTKLYSPFYIETPKEKENIMNQELMRKRSPNRGRFLLARRKIKHEPKGSSLNKIPYPSSDIEPERLTNDLLQTQLGIYEFQSIACSIVQGEKQ